MDNLYEFSSIPYDIPQSKISQFLSQASRFNVPYANTRLAIFKDSENLLLTRYFPEFSYGLYTMGDFVVAPTFLLAFLKKPFMLNIYWQDVSPASIDQEDVNNSLMLLHSRQVAVLKKAIDSQHDSPYYTIQDDGEGYLAIMSLENPVKEPNRIFRLPAVEKDFDW